ncbi:MAG TPA: murein L,D-transpeptidase catalytic domain family protein [Gammaproteobacteria bacterium]|nr:murein L,D-transpeptidase catalytic domain family protein [Gammaproteobacteria bacterium]
MRNYLLLMLSFLCIAGCKPSFTSDAATHTENVGSKAWVADETRAITAQASNLSPTVLKVSLTAYAKARQQGLDAKQLLTIVDYSKPSSERRLWVIDVKNEKVLFNTWVAHGKNSGTVNATSFSNQARSLKSSLGVFVTENSYIGGKGYALRIQGLERGINDNAYKRDVVFHGAWYANPDVAKERGMLGRSWGCLAVEQDVIKPLVDTIKNNTVVVAYYPDQNWLRNSTYLNT